MKEMYPMRTDQNPAHEGLPYPPLQKGVGDKGYFAGAREGSGSFESVRSLNIEKDSSLCSE